MPHVVWSARARQHLQRLDDFLRAKSPRAAERAAAAILEATLRLEQFPDAGRPADEYGPRRREWLVPFGTGGYIVLYRRLPDRVEIAAIRHQRERGYEP